MNKKCEICGQEKPQRDFSKSYKHRCKACVAEAARQERKRYKELESEWTIQPLHQFSQITPNPRYIIATAAMQGILSNMNILHTVIKTGMEVMTGDNITYRAVAKASIDFADALLAELDKTKSV